MQYFYKYNKTALFSFAAIASMATNCNKSQDKHAQETSTQTFGTAWNKKILKPVSNSKPIEECIKNIIEQENDQQEKVVLENLFPKDEENWALLLDQPIQNFLEENKDTLKASRTAYLTKIKEELISCNDTALTSLIPQLDAAADLDSFIALIGKEDADSISEDKKSKILSLNKAYNAKFVKEFLEWLAKTLKAKQDLAKKDPKLATLLQAIIPLLVQKLDTIVQSSEPSDKDDNQDEKKVNTDA